MRRVLGTIIALATRVLGTIFNAPSWSNWQALLKATFGLPLSPSELATFCRLTGRTRPPAGQVRVAWFICGRRAGKSIIAALIAIYQTCCRTFTLAPGERGIFMIIAADRKQARVIKRYVSGLLRAASALTSLIEHETAEAIHLTSGLVIEIHTASFRTLRGYTVVGAVCDETAFWPTDDSANPDAEIIAALVPAMATVPEAILVCITTPYRRTGEAWRAAKDHFGKDEDDWLVAIADTRTMNATVPEAVIEQAFRDDPAHASAEYGRDGRVEFRSDIDSYIAEEAIDAVTGAHAELPPVSGIAYRAGFDGAGGSVSGGDSQALAIAHDEPDGRTVLDLVREVQPPFNPDDAIAEFARTLRAYGVANVTGDRWAGEWPRQAFAKHGIAYDVCPQPKSELYRTLLPRINSGQVELRPGAKLRVQLLNLERHATRGGKDTIDHRPGGHDDLANVVAIVLAAGDASVRCEWCLDPQCSGFHILGPDLFEERRRRRVAQAIDALRSQWTDVKARVREGRWDEARDLGTALVGAVDAITDPAVRDAVDKHYEGLGLQLEEECGAAAR